MPRLTASIPAEKILARAERNGLRLTEPAARALELHAEAVLRANERLHLTTITEPHEFLERHLGEAFVAAAMVDPLASGLVLDLGSGSGYPAIPLWVCRPGLRLLLTEASRAKADFLRQALAETALVGAAVLERHVQRPADLEGVEPIRCLTSRAMGGWARVLPRFASCLDAAGELLVWSGDGMEAVRRRRVWQRFRLEEQRPIPGRDRSWVFRFRRAR